MGTFQIASMAELYFLIKLSVKPQDGLSQQVILMEKTDKKIEIMHRILYLTSAVVVILYTFLVIEFQIIVELGQNTEKQWFQSLYSWSSCLLLGILEVALIAVFFKLHKVIKENLVTRLMLRDKQILNRLFGLFILAYLLGAVYFWFFGSFKNWVCGQVLRWVGQDFVAVICDIPAGIAIFHLHHLNYKPRAISKSNNSD